MMGRLPSLLPEQNRLLFQTDPGTPGGTLLRRYWQPVSVVSELPLDGDPKPIKVMGEDLVLYKNPLGQFGLVGRRCPHRRADQANGIVEEQGICCSYHGWCLDAGRHEPVCGTALGRRGNVRAQHQVPHPHHHLPGPGQRWPAVVSAPSQI